MALTLLASNISLNRKIRTIFRIVRSPVGDQRYSSTLLTINFAIGYE